MLQGCWVARTPAWQPASRTDHFAWWLPHAHIFGLSLGLVCISGMGTYPPSYWRWMGGSKPNKLCIYLCMPPPLQGHPHCWYTVICVSVVLGLLPGWGGVSFPDQRARLRPPNLPVLERGCCFVFPSEVLHTEPLSHWASGPGKKG